MDEATVGSRDREELEGLSLAELHTLAREQGIKRYRLSKRATLIDQLAGSPKVDSPVEANVVAEVKEPAPVADDDASDGELVQLAPELAASEEPADESSSGLLDIRSEGFGLIRVGRFFPARGDVYVSQSQIRRLQLRAGDEVGGPARPQRRAERHVALVHVDTVNGREADSGAWLRERPRFEQLTAAPPTRELSIGKTAGLEALAPLKLGQRVLIAGPPGSEGGAALRSLTNAVATENSELKLFSLLIDPRPEDVTLWRREVEGELVPCEINRSPRVSLDVAKLLLEYSKRLAEAGADVVVAIDSLSRFAQLRALAEGSQSRGTGGVDLAALRAARKIFYSARDLEEESAGSLTILATAVAPESPGSDLALADDLAEAASAVLKIAAS